MSDLVRPVVPAAPPKPAGRERRPTMADVADHLGISRALVSIVFRGAEGASDATRERVIKAAAELGYRPDSLAQGLRRHRSRTLGVLFSLRRPFEVEFVECLYPLARPLGYDLLLGAFTPGRGQDVVVDELLRYRCAGLIVVGPDLHARDLEPLAKEVAVVEVGRGVTHGPVDVIRNDDAVGARLAVDHLVALGHRSIAYISGGENPGAERRTAGYRAAMTDHGLAAAITILPGGYDVEDGAQAARRLLDDGLPTAVIAANDMCAIGVLDALVRAGVSVPDQVSLVGYDDSLFHRIPGVDLTSVRQNIPRMAKSTIKVMVERLEKPDRKPREVKIRPTLKVRGTTAAPHESVVAV